MVPDDKNCMIVNIQRIQTGDQVAREQFIEEYKPFIAKTAMQLCKRVLSWDNSDELSVAMVAFNSALDTYDTLKQVPFLQYAKVVIQNKLKDLFRKEAKHQTELAILDSTEERTGFLIETQTALSEFRNKTIEDERREEIIEYEKLLYDFGMDFEALVLVSPKHRDSRQNLFRTAQIIADNLLFKNYLMNKKQLPIAELVQATGINRKTLERGRKFIIATALVLINPLDFPYIYWYIKDGRN